MSDPARCGAKTRSRPGGTCRRVAGWGTDHKGIGRCRLHGGANPSKHGMKSKTKLHALRELVAQYEADPDPLNLRREVAEIRALTHDYLEKHGTDAFEHEAAAKLIETASRVVKRIEDIRAQNAISRADLLRVMGEMGRVVARFVDDNETRERIQDAWLAIRL